MEEGGEVVDLPPGVTQKGHRELGGKATSIIGMVGASTTMEGEGLAEHDGNTDMFLSKILKAQERHKCFTLGKWFLNYYSHMVGIRETLDNMFGSRFLQV